MTSANPSVLEFYKELPFNFGGSVKEHAAIIRANDQIAHYPVLLPLLERGPSLLDVGCGPGWFSNSAALYHGCSVQGIDFNPVAVERAREIASALKVDSRFDVADLFTYVPPVRFDIVVSLGVLHHTNDCLGAVERLFREFVRPGGHVFLGLYHEYGRRPFLRHFASLRESGASEAALITEYARLDRRFSDPVRLRSWFRDQVLHPHETQHTLLQICEVADRCDAQILSTSINRFGSIEDLEALVHKEKELEEVGRQRLANGDYFPGFFLVLARRRP